MRVNFVVLFFVVGLSAIGIFVSWPRGHRPTAQLSSLCNLWTMEEEWSEVKRHEIFVGDVKGVKPDDAAVMKCYVETYDQILGDATIPAEHMPGNWSPDSKEVDFLTMRLCLLKHKPMTWTKGEERKWWKDERDEYVKWLADRDSLQEKNR